MAGSAGGSESSKSESELLAKSFDREELAMKEVMEFFMKTDDKNLLQHQKCISSTVNFVDYQFVEDSIRKLDPVMLVEHGKSTIVAFKKAPKPSTGVPESRVTMLRPAK